eukprot:8614-Heterococcus_DN1.PRE.3
MRHDAVSKGYDIQKKSISLKNRRKQAAVITPQPSIMPRDEASKQLHEYSQKASKQRALLTTSMPHSESAALCLRAERSRKNANHNAECCSFQSMQLSPQVLTTANGRPLESITTVQTAGPRGPMLLQDFNHFEHMTAFDRERVPERVVHANGHGYETSTHIIFLLIK